MPIPPYDRSAPPPEMDNAAHGRPCQVISLFDLGASRPFARTVTRLPDASLAASRVYDATGRAVQVPHHLQACTAAFHLAFTEPVSARLFMPYHGTLVRHGAEHAIVQESLWHDQLFFSGPIRNDASTGWRWRIDEDWSHSIAHAGLVHHCYHRFHFQFFHWMMDCLPRAWMLRKYSPYGKDAKWLVGPLDRPFHQPCLDLLGISAADCLTLPHGSIARFDRLVIPAFTFEEPLQTLRPSYDSGIHHTGWSQAYLDDIRGLAWDRYGCAERSDLRVYVSRGDASHRRLRNEAEVVRLLVSHGFVVVEPGTLPFQRQVEIFSRASIVVGLHGAGLTNLMWARPICDVLEFASEDLNDTGYRFLSDLCGHRHSAILCRAFEHPQGVAYADLEVDIVALRYALSDLLAAKPAAAGGAVGHGGVASATAARATDPAFEVERESWTSLAPAEESLARRDYARALRQALAFSTRNPGNGWGWRTAARAYRELGDYEPMKTALRRALTLPDIDSHIGAVFELLRFSMASGDFSEIDLVDFALVEAEQSSQKRWYKGGLLFLKALGFIQAGALSEADLTLRQAYAYRTDTDETELLFPWVVTRLAEQGALDAFPYLEYLMHRAAMRGGDIDYAAALSRLGGDTFVLEIGAMDGVRFDTLHEFVASRNWRAVMVEPTRGMFERLVANYAAHPNVRCARVAISNRTGSLVMHRIDPAAVASGEVGEWALGLSAMTADKSLKFYDDKLQSEEVQAITLADFLAREGIDRIDVLQIDTEGHDFIIFDQIDFDAHPIGILHIELINLDPTDRLRMFKRLRERGYRYHYDGTDLTAIRP